MKVKYLVPILAQPTVSTCFHTCLVMLDRYRSERTGIFHRPSELESMLFPDSKKMRYTGASNQYLLWSGPTGTGPLLSDFRPWTDSALLKPSEARELAKRIGFAYSSIELTPAEFGRILTSFGPFL
jgi:hypothetical protein